MNTTNNENTEGGIVYVLTNQAMPGYVKIGKSTTSVDQRIRELSQSTSVPLPFECHYACRVVNMNKVEAALHDAFGDHRINPRREFFTISPERIVAILKLLAVEDVTPSKYVGVETKEDAIAIERARKRRSAFNFKMVDIPAGAELKFIRDENVVCIVAPDQKHVIFNGKEMSSSEAAALAMGSEWWPQGPGYWTYEGETLDERRLRMEEDDDEPTAKEIEAAGDEWQSLQADIARGK